MRGKEKERKKKEHRVPGEEGSGKIFGHSPRGVPSDRRSSPSGCANGQIARVGIRDIRDFVRKKERDEDENVSRARASHSCDYHHATVLRRLGDNKGYRRKKRI